MCPPFLCRAGRVSAKCHGNLFAGSHPATFFFGREKQGIAAFSAGGPMMHYYYRLTATELPPGTVTGRKRWSMN